MAGQDQWGGGARVGIKLFFPEEFSTQSQALFSPLDGSFPRLFVPDLFYFERGNILWKYVRRFGYPAPEARKNMTALRNLNLKIISSASLVERALDLALRFEVTAYDACYLALAEELKVTLVTADQKLFKGLKGGPIGLKSIGDFSKLT